MVSDLERFQETQLEEEVHRSPYSVKLWLGYLRLKPVAPPKFRYSLYERALTFIPRSYKLWKAYLLERRANLCVDKLSSKRLQSLFDVFERSLLHMHKMPQIWLMYLELLIETKRFSLVKETFDRALQALPITQHERIWEPYVVWAKECGVTDVSIRVFHRYVMFDSNSMEDFVEFLEDSEQWSEAAVQIVKCLNDEKFISSRGTTRHQLWQKLCTLCSTHAEDISEALNVEMIIRGGISKFSDEVGYLWNSLAQYYIRLGQFDKARDVFEEAINSVITVRDFTIVFDSYLKIEEYQIMAKMKQLKELADGMDALAVQLTNELNLQLARLEYLTDTRPLLLNSVSLRQNIHNVYEWLKRCNFYRDNDRKLLLTYSEAIRYIEPKKAYGKLSAIWIALARYYAKRDNLDQARETFRNATLVDYKTIDELCYLYCEWIEFELRNQRFSEALSVARIAVDDSRLRYKAAAPSSSGAADNEDEVYSGVSVWMLYLDLEESFGTLNSCRAAYDRALDIKIATAQMCLNYAKLLEERNYFEDSFKVYERALELFSFPQAKAIWKIYIDRFVNRYSGTKMERLRDMFERVVAAAPASDLADYYVQYALLEERYGLARHSLSVYDRASRALPEMQKIDMYRLYIKKMEQFHGITKTRPIYERALRELSDYNSRLICLEFAEMEMKLGEVDRCRAIFRYGSQISDPRRENKFWQAWRDFEEKHGSEETFREMLRIQRSVEVAFAHVRYLSGTNNSAASSEATKPSNDFAKASSTVNA